jgi:hypothetical protein
MSHKFLIKTQQKGRRSGGGNENKNQVGFNLKNVSSKISVFDK